MMLKASSLLCVSREGFVRVTEQKKRNIGRKKPCQAERERLRGAKYRPVKRNITIDALKGWGIYFVVMGHFIYNTYAIFLIPEQSVYITKFIYSFHMPLFFVISGYCNAWSLYKYNTQQYFIRKTKSLLIPFFFWTMSAVALNLIYFRNDPDIRTVFCRLMLQCFVYTPSVWYFLILYLSTLIFRVDIVFGNILAKKFNPKFRILSHLLFWFFIILLPNDIFTFLWFEHLYPYFILGYYLNIYSNELAVHIEKNLSKIVFISLLFIPMTVLGYVFDFPPLHSDVTFVDSYSFLYANIWALTGCLFSYMLVKHCLTKLSSIRSLCVSFGEYSLDIYGIHMVLVRNLNFIPLLIFMIRPVFLMIINPVYCVFVCIIITVLSKLVLHKVRLYSILFSGR